MARQKRHASRVYQLIGEPGPGAKAVGYVRYSMELQDPASIVTQKRRIEEYAHTKGWTIVRWYEEPAARPAGAGASRWRLHQSRAQRSHSHRR